MSDRHVGCLVHYHGKLRDSGSEVSARAVDMWEIREGKIVRGTLGYPDRESALKAIGLPDQDAHAD